MAMTPAGELMYLPGEIWTTLVVCLASSCGRGEVDDG